MPSIVAIDPVTCFRHGGLSDKGIDIHSIPYLTFETLSCFQGRRMDQEIIASAAVEHTEKGSNRHIIAR